MLVAGIHRVFVCEWWASRWGVSLLFFMKLVGVQNEYRTIQFPTKRSPAGWRRLPTSNAVFSKTKKVS